MRMFISRPAEKPVFDDSRCGAVGPIGVREGVLLLLIGPLLNTGYNSLLRNAFVCEICGNWGKLLCNCVITVYIIYEALNI